MQTIKFVAKDKNQKEFAAELSKRVRQYFKKNNTSKFGGTKIIVKAALMLTLYIAPLVLVFTIDFPAWAALLLMVVIGIGKAGIGMGVMHDAAHGSFSQRKWLNNLMANSMFLLGSSLINWKIQHNVLHHTYPNVYEYDNDIDTKALIRLSKHADHHRVFKYQYIFGPLLYSFMTLARFVGDFQQLAQYNRMGALKIYDSSFAKNLWTMIISKLLYIGVFLVLPFFLTDFAWWQILIGFFIIHAVASMIMGTVFQLAHVVEGMDEPLPNEEGVINNQFFVHQLETTSDFSSKKNLLGWYVGGLDFQAIHHLFPNVSHVHYYDLAHIVRETAKEYGQPYNLQKSFFTALRSHLVMLKKLGQQA